MPLLALQINIICTSRGLWAPIATNISKYICKYLQIKI